MIITERDKKLLYILSVMLVLALGVYLLLLPAYRGYTDQLEQLDTANAEYDRRQAVITTADVTQASINELSQKLAPELAGYPSVMHNLDLDRRHTLRAVMQLWEPTKLELQPMAPLQIVQFGVAVGEDQESTEQAAANAPWLAASSISMSANARRSDAVTLIDTIVRSPSERLDTLKITPKEIEVTLDAEGNATVEMELDNPYLTIEMTTQQFYALNRQTPELELPGTSFQ